MKMKKLEKNRKPIIGVLVAKAALKLAKADINCVSGVWNYQPDLPQGAERLKRK